MYMYPSPWLQVDIFSYAMLLFELLAGQRPFDSLASIQGRNTLICKGERPLMSECNLEPSFPAMVDLMEDCWNQLPSERPAAREVRSLLVYTVLGYILKDVGEANHATI